MATADDGPPGSSDYEARVAAGVSFASAGLEEGYRVIADELNSVLRQTAPGIRITADPLRQADSLEKGMATFGDGIRLLRGCVPIGDDRDIVVWTLGAANESSLTNITLLGVNSTGSLDLKPFRETLANFLNGEAHNYDSVS